jgi:hypothetical protein
MGEIVFLPDEIALRTFAAAVGSENQNIHVPLLLWSTDIISKNTGPA